MGAAPGESWKINGFRKEVGRPWYARQPNPLVRLVWSIGMVLQSMEVGHRDRASLQMVAAFVHASTRQLSHPRVDPIFAHHSKRRFHIDCGSIPCTFGEHPGLVGAHQWMVLVDSDAQEEPQGGSVYLTDPKPEPKRGGSDSEPGMGWSLQATSETHSMRRGGSCPNGTLSNQ